MVIVLYLKEYVKIKKKIGWGLFLKNVYFVKNVVWKCFFVLFIFYDNYLFCFIYKEFNDIEFDSNIIKKK